jgi:phenylalanyl-tRNA synthetase alpha chain
MNTIEEFSNAIDVAIQAALVELRASHTADDIRSVVRKLSGRRGALKNLRSQLGRLPAEDRPRAGLLLDQAVATLEDSAAEAGRSVGRRSSLDVDFDPTVPGIDQLAGGLHPTIQMMYDLNDAFAQLNFDIYSGPEVSSELYEFDYMNFPPNHPARESMDTYWIRDPRSSKPMDRLCIRPHLTGASVRYMQDNDPPYRLAYPGRVYRNESTDARHERAFFQYEALIVDRNVTFSAGKLLTSTVLDTVFGRKVPTRMRTGFFPFVEPGFEIDMQCQVCFGKGCNVCGRVGWLEIMPGGVPHPNVLRAGGLDPDEWTGFYVNVGLDRLVMMRYGIDDVRLFNSSDLRFLSQFK